VWSDSKGLLWVSFWHSGEVGVYDPAAKTWKTWLLPNNPGSGCYSVYVDEQDKVWLTDFMTNSIVRFDPATEKFESFPSDRRGAQVRQMLGRPGEAWGAESGNNRLVLVRY
jgi:virginiamycin B lyase